MQTKISKPSNVQYVYLVTNVFWDVAPCSFVESDRRFRGTYCLHHQDIAQRNIPEDGHLYTHRRENLKFHVCFHATYSFVQEED